MSREARAANRVLRVLGTGIFHSGVEAPPFCPGFRV